MWWACQKLSLYVKDMNMPITSNAIAHWRKHDACEQSLQSHLEGVGALSGQFAGKLGLEMAGELIGLLHDLGKYSEEIGRAHV